MELLAESEAQKMLLSKFCQIALCKVTNFLKNEDLTFYGALHIMAVFLAYDSIEWPKRRFFVRRLPDK